MPSTPSFPPEQKTRVYAYGGREFESYEWYESGTLTLAANALFQEIITFSGRPDAITFQATVVGLNFRFRNRGQAGGSSIRAAVAATQELNIAAEIVEVQDPTGAGGQIAVAVGKYASRDVDYRNNRPGPRRPDARVTHEAALITATPPAKY